ncbi:MAG: hypothetical protein R2688_03985 [Fimbriimonadaceae bacterium]
MILHVDWDSFTDEVRERFPSGVTVYLRRFAGTTQASVGDPASNMVMLTSAPLPLNAVEGILSSVGFKTSRGHWSTESDIAEDGETWIGAVAYQSDEDRPGLWVDAFDHNPTKSEVLDALLDEFTDDGLIQNIDRTAFQDSARPNVIIVEPDELQGMLIRKRNSPPKVEEVEEVEEPEVE